MLYTLILQFIHSNLLASRRTEGEGEREGGEREKGEREDGKVEEGERRGGRGRAGA